MKSLTSILTHARVNVLLMSKAFSGKWSFLIVQDLSNGDCLTLSWGFPKWDRTIYNIDIFRHSYSSDIQCQQFDFKDLHNCESVQMLFLHCQSYRPTMWANMHMQCVWVEWNRAFILLLVTAVKEAKKGPNVFPTCLLWIEPITMYAFSRYS